MEREIHQTRYTFPQKERRQNEKQNRNKRNTNTYIDRDTRLTYNVGRNMSAPEAGGHAHTKRGGTQDKEAYGGNRVELQEESEIEGSQGGPRKKGRVYSEWLMD